MEAVKAVVMFHTQALFGRAMYCKVSESDSYSIQLYFINALRWIARTMSLQNRRRRSCPRDWPDLMLIRTYWIFPQERGLERSGGSSHSRDFALWDLFFFRISFIRFSIRARKIYFKPAPASQVPVYNPPPMRDPYGGYQQMNNVNTQMLHSHGSGCVITVDRLPPSATQQRLRTGSSVIRDFISLRVP